MPSSVRSLVLSALAVGILASPVQGSAHPNAYLAPAGYCSGGSVRVMICLHDYARRQAGLAPLHVSIRLMRAASAKSADIVRCGFSHTACGHQFQYRIVWAGYRWTWIGENIAWGTGPLRRPYSIFSAWMRSPEHRANILSNDFRDLGVAVRNGSAIGHPKAAFWVAEFGHH